MRAGFINFIKNLGIGTTTVGTNGDKVLVIANGTAPTSSPANSVQLYAEDVTDTYTKVLLHCDGDDGSTTFTDSSSYNNNILKGGQVQVDTSEKKFGTGSCLLDGNGDFLRLPNTYYLSNVDWTFECWVYANSISGNNAILGYYTDSSNYFDIYHNSSNGWRVKIKVSGSYICDIAETSSPISTGEWIHLAVVRNGDTFTLYENGISLGTSTSSTSIPNFTSTVYISYAFYDTSASIYWNGWIDELRYSVGIARWTSNFTPATVAYGEVTVSELKVRDEAGNVTVLSPHNFSLIEKSHPLAWSYHSENDNYIIEVDMFKVIKIAEKLTNKKFMIIKRN